MNDWMNRIRRLLFDEDSGGGTGGTEGTENPPVSEDKPEETKPDEDKNLLALEDKEAGDGKDGNQITLESLKAPEGREWDAETSGAFLSILNDSKLSKAELAQKLVDMHSAQLDRMNASIDADIKKTSEDWKAASLKDKEYGGEAFEANIRHINAGRDKLATPEAVDILKAYGLDNHPDIVRMFYRAGKLVAEDAGTTTGTVNEAKTSVDPLVEMYRKSLEGE
jgi:hypothetical protein